MPLNDFVSKLGKFGDFIKDCMDEIDDKVDLPIIIGELSLYG